MYFITRIENLCNNGRYFKEQGLNCNQCNEKLIFVCKSGCLFVTFAIILANYIVNKLTVCMKLIVHAEIFLTK